jgi:hypothetical protein
MTRQEARSGTHRRFDLGVPGKSLCTEMKSARRAASADKDLARDLGALYLEVTGFFHNCVAAAGLDKKVDFRNRDLRDFEFSNADLRGFNFYGSDLRGTHIRAARACDETTVFTGAQIDPEDEMWLSQRAGLYRNETGDRRVRTSTEKTPNARGLGISDNAEVPGFIERQQEIMSLVSAVSEEKVTILTGRAGSGKTALVLSGLVPTLEQLRDDREWVCLKLHIRDQSDVPFENNVFGNLLSKLPEDVDISWLNVAENDNLSYSRVLGIAQCVVYSGRRALVIIDDVEEIIPPDDGGYDFLTWLQTIVRDLGEGISLLVVARGNLCHRIASIGNHRIVYLDDFSRSNLERIALNIAQKAQVSFEEELLKTLLDGLSYSPAEIVSLLITISLLWDRRENSVLSLKSYHELGNSGHIGLVLGVELGRADVVEVFRKLWNKERRTCNVVRETKFDATERAAIERLIARGIIRRQGHPGAETVEFSHDYIGKMCDEMLRMKTNVFVNDS